MFSLFFFNSENQVCDVHSGIQMTEKLQFGALFIFAVLSKFMFSAHVQFSARVMANV